MVNFKDYKKIKLHHFGYVVKKIDSSVISSFYPVIKNKKPLLKFTDYGQKVKVAFFKSNLKGYIELVEPMNKKSPVSNFLKKTGHGGMHHVCFESDDLTKSIIFFKKNKFIKISPIKIGFEEREVVFMMPVSKSNFLLELVSTSKQKTVLPIK